MRYGFAPEPALFQSTHPVRGATRAKLSNTQRDRNFNPRTPCGVRRTSRAARPARPSISIHAPRAGCDAGDLFHGAARQNFNPRTPCGVRPIRCSPAVAIARAFQSTHPVRGATAQDAEHNFLILISIHAPRAGCDALSCPRCNRRRRFQSTHPVRGATAPSGTTARWSLFQSTHPVRGATWAIFSDSFYNVKFQSTHPVRGATSKYLIYDNGASQFQSTHPVRGATE